jgi:hypothetical protein
LTHASLALEIRMNISSAASLHGTVCPIKAHASSDEPGFLSGCLGRGVTVSRNHCSGSVPSGPQDQVQSVVGLPSFALFTVCFFDLIFLCSFLWSRRCGKSIRCERRGRQVRRHHRPQQRDAKPKKRERSSTAMRQGRGCVEPRLRESRKD